MNSRSKTHEYKLYVSYLEIYNEQCYDLLDKDHLDLPLEEWNKVVYDY
jgi:kinesin family protein 6/9